MSLLYIIQSITKPSPVLIHTSLSAATASGASVNPASQIYSSAMLVLSIVENWKFGF
jgi:hypothetical protein